MNKNADENLEEKNVNQFDDSIEKTIKPKKRSKQKIKINSDELINKLESHYSSIFEKNLCIFSESL